MMFAGATWAFAQSDAVLELKPSVLSANTGDEFTVDVLLKNPSAEAVISVRSWLEYDSKALEAVNIDTSDSDFTLSAPGEDTVSASEGRVKIGRSNISGGVSATEATVAHVTFKVVSAYSIKTKIGFYDYQVSELGHTSVNIIDSGFPLNILSEAPKEIELTLNPGGSQTPQNGGQGNTSGTAQENPAVNTTPITTVPSGSNNLNSSLQSPANLKVNTGSGYADLVWESNYDSQRIGFNIYYGKTSGQYSRRRTIGNLSGYRIEGLNNNEAYYFAVTAYDTQNQESDYSNEVAVIINQPLSSTHPFQSVLENALSRLPSQPQNGPLVGWLIFTATGLSAAILFGKKRVKLENEMV